MNKNILSLSLCAILLFGCNETKKPEPIAEPAPEPVALNAAPEWIDDAVIYEVNLRQYSEEGTINKFAESLPRLKEMGVDILWFMPIHPIGVKNRKGTMGSYYSIQDYKAVNSEFGTIEDFKAAVAKAHDLGMKVIIDLVANHSAWDTDWITEHPEYYSQDSAGNIIPPNPDWSDVADLNYDNDSMRLAMIDAMKFWITEADIDGYRCDVAGEVPMDFWDAAIRELRDTKEIFMLAEWDEPKMHTSFNATYGWGYHHMLMEIGKGEWNIDSIRTYFEKDLARYPSDAYRLRFNTNHDENSWKGTEAALFGPLSDNFQILGYTAPGMPLIYSGQESNLDRQLEFFEKDIIDWKTFEKADFLTKLADLKHTQSALKAGAEAGDFKVLASDPAVGLLVYDRMNDENHIRVILNCSENANDISAFTKGEVLFSTDENAGSELAAYKGIVYKIK